MAAALLALAQDYPLPGREIHRMARILKALHHHVIGRAQARKTRTSSACVAHLIVFRRSWRKGSKLTPVLGRFFL